MIINFDIIPVGSFFHLFIWEMVESDSESQASAYSEMAPTYSENKPPVVINKNDPRLVHKLDENVVHILDHFAFGIRVENLRYRVIKRDNCYVTYQQYKHFMKLRNKSLLQPEYSTTESESERSLL